LKKQLVAIGVIAGALVIGGAAWVGMGSNGASVDVTELTIYSGRSEEFIAPFFAQWEQESGIKLNIRYGDSAELAAQIPSPATKPAPTTSAPTKDLRNQNSLEISTLGVKYPHVE